MQARDGQSSLWRVLHVPRRHRNRRGRPRRDVSGLQIDSADQRTRGYAVTRPISGIIKHPTAIMAGRQHLSATSFKPKNVDATEKAKLFREQGVVWVSPTRGRIYTNVVCSWLSLQWPTNHLRSPLLATENMEV